MTLIEKYDALINWINLNRSGFNTQTEVIEAIRKNSRIEGYIRDLSLILYQKTLGTCGNCLADAMIAVRKFPREKLIEIMNCKFKLKSGALLIDVTGRLPEATSANLTDEIALAYLRDNIKRADMFEQLPENIEELLENQSDEAEQNGVSNGEKDAEKLPSKKAQAGEERNKDEDEQKGSQDDPEADTNNEPKK